VRTITKRLESVTGGVLVLPLLVLFVLNLVDELDQVAFGILAPEIAHDFGLSESSFVSLSTVAGALVIVLIVPVGVLADRRNRVRMSGVAAIAWCACSVLTGLAPGLAILVLARFGSGLGRVMNEPVHASLLADYYPPAQHGKVFSFHRFANTVGALLVLVAGTLGAVFGWRATFVVLALPTIPAILLLSRLHEPVRGASLDSGLALEADTAAERVPMMEAFRRLAAIPTLKRMWVAAFFFGAGLIPIATFSAFFYENVYNLGPGPWGRAGIHAIFAIGSMVGLRIGSKYSTATLMRGEPEGLAHLTAVCIIAGAGALIFMASAPWVGLSIVGSFLIGVTLGGFGSYYLPLVAAVTPPRLRSQSFGWIGLWFAVGAIVLAGIVGNIADERGYRYGITTLAFVVGIAGFIFLTIKPLVRKDASNAFETLQAEARVRK
jgi:MFS family permease